MPRFSVIVPAYKVQAHLHACLRSVLEQSYPDLELLAVDDCSPDSCGAIIDEFAARDARVVPLHLPRTSGSGPARNAGLARACGDYVLLLDGDDSLTPGALDALAVRLKETEEPDLLLYGHAYVLWTGEEVPDPFADRLAAAGDGPVPSFRPEDRPGLLALPPVVWNKAYRRDFLERELLLFPPGGHGDPAWTYPVLLTAKSIAPLDRVCVHRRRGRHHETGAGASYPGAVFPGTGGGRPFDVFAQYDRVFARLADRPDLARWRPVVFHRMVDHLTALFEGCGRQLPRGARAEFLRRARAHCRRHRVRRGGLRRAGGGSLPGPANAGPVSAGPASAGPALPGAARAEAGPGAGHRMRRLLVRLGSRRTYRLLSLAVLQARRARRAAGPVGRGLGAAALRLHYRTQRLLPVRADRAVFASHGGQPYGCNPGALEAAFRELAPRIRTTWITRPEHRHTVPPCTRGVRPGSFAYWTALARSRYLVGNAPFDARLRKRPGQIVVQTQAGTPLKRVGLDVRDRPAVVREGEVERLLRDADRWDYVLSGNRHSTLVWERAFPAAFTILEYGLPRTDRFHRAGAEETARLRASLGIPPHAVAVLYAPTFRDYRRTPYRPLDPERVLRRLGPGFVLLTRAHPAYGEPMVRVRDAPGLLDVSGHPSVESLCLASDALLTDYSSLMFDYTGLDRPVVIHAEDREAYEAARGTYFDLRTFPPGEVTHSEDEVVDVFLSGRYGGMRAARRRAAFRERFCPYDDGRAAERVVRHVVFGERGLAAGRPPGVVEP
ncbi:glycosyl transferase [Streptomyces griseoaurantiacus M045]|uniref:Glycosyl transferase n=1 Tax=Streptomyces griseoaurantiacus M045 TaxID=996637 RepID=F3NDR0_9ACTN|nr:bifunctional glycosyltransferase family 2 protein/CDP-glycerol:glycerophosphate glycerophosphotransferase [Streptomyces griseoaurantiacus]EGG48465.1 glycosyl transferase [Streptomyces griseoaurantiacus M045]